MEIDRNQINAKEKEKELFQGLEKLSLRLKRGNDNSIEALYELKELLDGSDLFEVTGEINPRLVSVVWILKTFIHDLWANLGGDNRGLPETGGKEILQETIKHLGVFIQNSLFRNRPKDSIGTFEDVIKSYYDLLHVTEESFKKADPAEKYIAL